MRLADYGTRLITPKILKEALDRHDRAEAVKALVVLHFGGQAAPMLEENGKGLLSLCRDNGIKIDRFGPTGAG